MTNTVDSEMLTEIVSEVLEEAAFIFTETADETLNWNDDVVESTITYEGQENGKLSLAVDNEMARNFAANLLGIEPDDPAAASRSEEAVSEMLNIVCGIFVERWLGKTNHCRLGIPSTKAISIDEELSHFRSAKCNAVLEDEEGKRIDIYVR
ncbi:MAG: chemotaxis protein CheX [Deltaproteobacteria bacterium]|nr:chemotaxis protein CheX [Deltaproteobacteria bacterium]MBN2674555.1 chemotaxis protein CheX [Deltaproteobacteria bacterium]